MATQVVAAPKVLALEVGRAVKVDEAHVKGRPRGSKHTSTSVSKVECVKHDCSPRLGLSLLLLMRHSTRGMQILGSLKYHVSGSMCCKCTVVLLTSVSVFFSCCYNPSSFFSKSFVFRLGLTPFYFVTSSMSSHLCSTLFHLHLLASFQICFRLVSEVFQYLTSHASVPHQSCFIQLFHTKYLVSPWYQLSCRPSLKDVHLYINPPGLYS